MFCVSNSDIILYLFGRVEYFVRNLALNYVFIVFKSIQCVHKNYSFFQAAGVRSYRDFVIPDTLDDITLYAHVRLTIF